MAWYCFGITMLHPPLIAQHDFPHITPAVALEGEDVDGRCQLIDFEFDFMPAGRLYTLVRYRDSTPQHIVKDDLDAAGCRHFISHVDRADGRIRIHIRDLQ